MSNPSDIVGHKTFSDGRGGFRHEPLTREEAEALWTSIEQAKADRATAYPTEQDCIRTIFHACQRLEELGWKRADYAPPDGEMRDTISIGSTGIHKAYCETRSDRTGERWWWCPDEGDLWPHDPIYYKP